MAKYKFYAKAGDTYVAPLHETDVEEFDDNISEDELEEIAKEHMWDCVSPEYWWEKVDD